MKNYKNHFSSLRKSERFFLSQFALIFENGTDSAPQLFNGRK
jgi:hypothetical protein